jgi:hypothetical protein
MNTRPYEAILMDSTRPFNHFIDIVFNTMYTTRIRRIDDVCHVITLPTAILGRLQQHVLTSETTCLFNNILLR